MKMMFYFEAKIVIVCRKLCTSLLKHMIFIILNVSLDFLYIFISDVLCRLQRFIQIRFEMSHMLLKLPVLEAEYPEKSYIDDLQIF